VGKIFTKKEAAQALCISIETLDKYRRQGKISFRMIGDRILFTERDLIDFIESCLIPATVRLSPREKIEMAKVMGDKYEGTRIHSGEIRSGC